MRVSLSASKRRASVVKAKGLNHQGGVGQEIDLCPRYRGRELIGKLRVSLDLTSTRGIEQKNVLDSPAQQIQKRKERSGSPLA